MEHDIPKLLRKMMEALPGTQAQLAHRLSDGSLEISQPQVSRWIRGQKPEVEPYNRILAVAHDLGVLQDMRSEDVAASLPEPTPRPKRIKVKGYVGASSEAHFYALADEDFEEVDAPTGATDKTVAVEIRGKSMGPLLDSWLVFYADVRSPVTPDLIGHLCVVGLEDDRILVKRIQSDGNGGFDLLSNSGEPPITGAAVEWAAKVTDLRPR